MMSPLLVISPLQEDAKSRFLQTLLFLLSAALFVYVAVRAYVLSFTHDEAFTYLSYIRATWKNAANVEFSNNHLLNTLLAKISFAVFGDSEFSLRLPNVLSFVLFLYAAVKLSLKLFSPIVSVLCWCLLCLNPFVLDFFSLCRGYGLSLAFFLFALFQLYAWLLEDGKFYRLLLVLLSMMMAVAANLTMVNLFISMMGVYLLFFIIERAGVVVNRNLNRQGGWPALLFSIAAGAWFLSFMIKILLKLSGSGSLDFGGKAGFMDDTVDSVSRATVYMIYNLRDLMNIAVKVLFLFPFAILPFVLFSALKKKISRGPFVFSLFAGGILFSCVSAILLEHFLLHISYPQDRVVVYLLPLFAVFLSFTLDSFPMRLLRNSLSAVFIILSLGIFIPSVQIRWTYMWLSDAGVKDCMNDLKIQPGILNPETPFTADADFLQKPAFNYYRLRLALEQVSPSDHDFFPTCGTSEYVLIPVFDKGQYPCAKQVSVHEYSVLLETKMPLLHVIWSDSTDFENGFESRKSVVKVPFALSGANAETIGPENIFSYGFTDSVIDFHSLVNAPVFAGFAIRVPAKGAEVLAVLMVTRNNQTVFWHAQSTLNYETRPDEWSRLHAVFHLPPDLQNGDKILFYILDTGKDAVWLDDLSLRIYNKAENVSSYGN